MYFILPAELSKLNIIECIWIESILYKGGLYAGFFIERFKEFRIVTVTDPQSMNSPFFDKLLEDSPDFKCFL